MKTYHSAYTLIEMIVSMTILSIITVGIGSTMLLATRALPEASSPMQSVLSSSAAIDRLSNDIPYATRVSNATSKSITFTVADRDNDQIDEQFTYAWSGTAGDPLTLQINSQSPFTLLSSVENFGLAYDCVTLSQEEDAGTESSETLLHSYNATDDLVNYTIKEKEWIGQYIKPSLPANALHWSIQRVEFYARTKGPVDGMAKIQIQSATSGKWPSSYVYEEKLLDESSLLSSYMLKTFSFLTITELDPDQGVCLVIQHVSGAEVCEIQGHDKAEDLSGTQLVETTDAGTSWSLPTEKSMLFWIFGTVTTSGNPQVNTTEYLSAVRLTLNTGTQDETLVQTAIPLLNQPRVTP